MSDLTITLATKKAKYKGVVLATASYLIDLACTEIFCVTFVLDGPTRYHTNETSFATKASEKRVFSY